MAERFIKKLALFVAPLIIIAYLLSYAADSGLRKTRCYPYALWNDVYSSGINSDLIILGSSRARKHFSPAILDKTLSLNSYNFGIDGHTFCTHKYLLKAYLKHNKPPRFVIISLDRSTLKKRPDLVLREQFLAYLNEPFIQEATKGYDGEFSFFDYHLPYYKYVSNKLSARVGIFEFFGIRHFEATGYKGYEGQEKLWDKAVDDFYEKNKKGIVQDTDERAIDSFKDTLDICKNNNIRIIMVLSPEYKKSQNMCTNRASIIRMLKGYAVRYNAVFLDYSEDPICYDKSLFCDLNHMNKKGAEIFSRKLAGDIKNML